MSKMKFALVAVAALAATAAFPVTLRLANNTWRDAVEPETATVVPPYSFAEVTFTSADQLRRVESNVETHNLVNQWQEDAGLFICELEGPSVDPEAEARSAEQAQAEAQAQAQAEAEAAATAEAQAKADAEPKAAAEAKAKADAATPAGKSTSKK